ALSCRAGSRRAPALRGREKRRAFLRQSRGCAHRDHAGGAPPHRRRDRPRSRRLHSIRELKDRVGEEVAVSPWVEISQERIDTFAKAIEDFQWIHVDPARAKDSPFGGTIAHGFLTLSLLSRLSEMTFSFSDRKMGVDYGLNRVRFTSPVPSGSRVRACFPLSKSQPL